ncbi:Phosphatidylglycerol/phosphatidylinositol transfer protein [Ananas comosus]|uniref:Phosphatidylglycerol/phosphatidylinositol transfer protein n=1 Tax=Ananas comosus TaxID=4615 RepID=A0A199V851_ANACO|nr:Phosphatidylglycerol/phosphatidylinositol transfer protein [Ananas comosus]
MANRFASLLLALFVLSPAIALATSVEKCNRGANYPVKVSGVEISPDPVARGEPATFTISASTVKWLTISDSFLAENAISEGKLVIDVKYFFLHVHQETKDLCEETSCPISSGDFSLAHQQTLPSITPPGSYTITMKMVGGGGEELTCITFGFSIGFIAPVADA